MLDIRKPIGFLFLIIGSILTVYALISPQIKELQVVGENPHTLQINLNLPCGISMFVFACIMLALAFRDELRKVDKQASKVSGHQD
jgi:hypothetical protein